MSVRRTVQQGPLTQIPAPLDANRRRADMTPLERQALDAANSQAAQAATDRSLARAQAARPENTTSQYAPKQAEFEKWCVDTRQWADGVIVSERKLLLFLQEFVEPRGNKLKRKHNSDEPEDLGLSSFNQYANAVVDLYKLQVSQTINNNSHPRGKSIKDYLNTIRRDSVQRKRDNYVDRGKGTAADTYTKDQLLKISEYFLNQNTPSDTRNRADFLMGHSTFLRGQSKRNWQFPDFFTMEATGEGPMTCTIVVIIQDQGKTNKFGKIEYSAFMRHKNAALCSVGALGFLLFSRFHMATEEFPDFTTNRNWYDIFVLLGDVTSDTRRRRKKDANGDWVHNDEGKAIWETYGVDSRKVPISYKTQYNAFKRALTACGVNISSVLHATRKSAPNIAEMDGSPEASTRRMGHWSHGTMESCYLTASLPYETIRSLAGFNANGGSFYIGRGSIEPPEALRRKIFPDADKWMAMYESSQIDRDIAGGNFLKMLIYLRDVILQDSVALMREFPEYHIWKHEIFSSPEYLSFSHALRNSISESEKSNPVDNQLRNAMPKFHDMITTNFVNVNSRMDQLEIGVKDNSDALNRFYATFVDTWRATAAAISAFPSAIQAVLPSNEVGTSNNFPLSNQVVNGDMNASQLAYPISELPSPFPALLPALSSEVPTLPSPPSTLQQTVEPPQIVLNPDVVVKYKMSRTLTTVEQVWREYTEGMLGNPAVRDLETVYQRKWRKEESESRYFLRRKELYDAIETRAKTNSIPITMAVQQLQELQMQQQNKSLDHLRKILKGNAV